MIRFRNKIVDGSRGLVFDRLMDTSVGALRCDVGMFVESRLNHQVDSFLLDKVWNHLRREAAISNLLALRQVSGND